MKESVLSLRKEATDYSTSTVYLLWEETLLGILNCPKGLKDLLTFTYKELVTRNYKRETAWVTEREWSDEKVNGEVLTVTHQGFWLKAIKWLAENNYCFDLIDLRIKDLIPPPRLDLMGGFRFSQKKHVTDALLKNHSGMFSAPTRWGKSTVILNILKAYPGVKTVVVAPGSDLLKQLVDDLRKKLPDREVKLMGAGSTVKYMSEDITVCSMDSMHKLCLDPEEVEAMRQRIAEDERREAADLAAGKKKKKGKKEKVVLMDPDSVRLLICDEPHAVVSDSRSDWIPKFSLARKIAVGATLSGRFDKKDALLEGIFGPLLANVTYREAVEEGSVCLITVAMLDWPIVPVAGTDRDYAMRTVFHKSDKMGRCMGWLSRVLPQDWQSLFFIKTEEQAEFFLDHVGRDVAIAMAKRLSKTDRDHMTEQVRKNRIKRVLCSDIYIQGVTFHDVMVLINGTGGGASTTTIQKPGRLAEVRPGKTGALLIDFNIRIDAKHANIKSPGAAALVRDSQARLNAYKNIGYNVVHLKPADFEEWLANSNIKAPDAR